MTSAGDTVLSLLDAGRPEAAAVGIPGGETLTFAGLADAAASLAAKLHAAGIGRGDRVALAEPDGDRFLLALFGVLAAGASAAPLNPAYTESEFRFYLEDLAPRILLVPPDGLTAARAAAAGLGVEVAGLSADGATLQLEGRAVEHGAADAENPGPDDVALLLHTSGTTSRPKQVPLLHRNLVASARTIAGFYGLGPADVSYCAMPLFHVHGLVASVLGALAGGGSVVVPRRFTPRGLLDDLDPHRITWVSAGPTTWSMVLERDGKSDGLAAASALRFLRSCSSALPATLLERVEGRFGVPLLEAYGMTEASHQIASNPLPPGERDRRLGRDRERNRDRDRRPGRVVPRGRASRARSVSAAPASRPATSGIPRRTPSRSSTAGSAPATSGRWGPTATSGSRAGSRR